MKLLMGMPVSFAELDGQTGYAELIGELDRLLVYYRRMVAVRKGRRSAAKERAKNMEYRSNADMQSGREEQDIPDKQGSREELDIQGMQSVWKDERNERGELSERNEHKRDERGERDKFEKQERRITLRMQKESGMQGSREKHDTPKKGIILRMQEGFDKQDSRDEREILNERSKPGVGKERDSWGNWNKQGK